MISKQNWWSSELRPDLAIGGDSQPFLMKDPLETICVIDITQKNIDYILKKKLVVIYMDKKCTQITKAHSNEKQSVKYH